MLAADKLVNKLKLHWSDQGSSFVASSDHFTLTRPKTYTMHDIGNFVTADESSNTLLVHYDVDLELGQIEFQRGNIFARKGRNSVLDSIATASGTEKFQRLAIGIGRPQQNYYQGHLMMSHELGDDEYADLYLRNKWPAEEFYAVESIVAPNAAALIELFVAGGVPKRTGTENFDYWTTLQQAALMKQKKAEANKKQAERARKQEAEGKTGKPAEEKPKIEAKPSSAAKTASITKKEAKK